MKAMTRREKGTVAKAVSVIHGSVTNIMTMTTTSCTAAVSDVLKELAMDWATVSTSLVTRESVSPRAWPSK